MSQNLSVKYYQENKERLQKKSCERYQNLSKVEKEKKRQFRREHYKDLSKDQKSKLVEYRKKCYRIRKNTILQLQFRKYCFFIRKSIRNFFLLRLCLRKI